MNAARARHTITLHARINMSALIVRSSPVSKSVLDRRPCPVRRRHARLEAEIMSRPPIGRSHDLGLAAILVGRTRIPQSANRRECRETDAEQGNHQRTLRSSPTPPSPRLLGRHRPRCRKAGDYAARNVRLVGSVPYSGGRRPGTDPMRAPLAAATAAHPGMSANHKHIMLATEYGARPGGLRADLPPGRRWGPWLPALPAPAAGSFPAVAEPEGHVRQAGDGAARLAAA